MWNRVYKVLWPTSRSRKQKKSILQNKQSTQGSRNMYKHTKSVLLITSKSDKNRHNSFVYFKDFSACFLAEKSNWWLLFLFQWWNISCRTSVTRRFLWWIRVVTERVWWHTSDKETETVGYILWESCGDWTKFLTSYRLLWDWLTYINCCGVGELSNSCCH